MIGIAVEATDEDNDDPILFLVSEAIDKCLVTGGCCCVDDWAATTLIFPAVCERNPALELDC